MATARVIIRKKKNENTSAMLRRFSRGTRDMVKSVKSDRYYSREDSKLRQQRSALRRISDGKMYSQLIKLGRITKRGRRG